MKLTYSYTDDGRITFSLYMDDLGSLYLKGCRDFYDFIREVNRARDHDGLADLTQHQVNLLYRIKKYEI